MADRSPAEKGYRRAPTRPIEEERAGEKKLISAQGLPGVGPFYEKSRELCQKYP